MAEDKYVMLGAGTSRTQTINYTPVVFFLSRGSTLEGVMGRSGASNCASVSP